jgi:arsenate reductase (thioredoxin)
MIRMKVLIPCPGNSFSSQIAHGFLQSFNSNTKVCSAGTNPAHKINEKAGAVMNKVGIDICHHKPESVEKYPGEVWEYVMTIKK